MKYLTVATCVKQEDPYIDDYIKIHQELGVEAFIFFDRDGDNLTNKFKGRNDIVVVKFPEPNRHAESHCYTVKHFQGFSKFIAFIDCDQVLFSPLNKDLKVVLQEFDKPNYAQVQPVWETFGSSGLTNKGDGSIYERFTKRAKSGEGINNHTQGVCDISKIQPIVPPDPHRLVPINGFISVDENHKSVGSTPHISPHTQNKLFVAHFYTKSKEEWDIKNNKLRADTGTRVDPNVFTEYNKFCNAVDDFRIKDFWERYCK